MIPISRRLIARDEGRCCARRDCFLSFRGSTNALQLSRRRICIFIDATRHLLPSVSSAVLVVNDPPLRALVTNVPRARIGTLSAAVAYARVRDFDLLLPVSVRIPLGTFLTFYLSPLLTVSYFIYAINDLSQQVRPRPPLSPVYLPLSRVRVSSRFSSSIAPVSIWILSYFICISDTSVIKRSPFYLQDAIT